MTIKGKFYCIYCSRCFVNKSQYDGHVNSHKIEESPYICQTCDKRFAYKSNLKRHPELFSTLFALESFWLTDHVMLAQQPFCWIFFNTFVSFKMWLCSVACGLMSFSHMNYNDTNRSTKKPHVCTKCGNGFTTKFALKDHMDRHDNKREILLYILQQMLCQQKSVWYLVVKPFPHFVQTWGFFVDLFVSL
jgi:hypothetical protein